MTAPDAGRHRPRFRLPSLVLLIGSLFAGGPVLASQPEPPATVTFAGTPAATQAPALTVTLNLTAVRPIRVRLRLFANPAEGQPLAGGLVAERVLSLGRSARETFAVPLAASGDIELTAIVEPAGGGVSDAEVQFVRFGDEGEVSAFTMADYLAMHGREVAARRPGFGHQPPRGPGGSALPLPRATAVSPDSAAGAAQPGGVHVGGGTISGGAAAPPGQPDGRKAMTAVAFQAGGGQLALSGQLSASVNGQTVLLRNTVLEIWDSDTLSPDDQLGTTRTDDNGNYAITVTNDDGPGGGGVDVYLYASTRQAKVAELYFVSDGQGGSFPFYYAWRSPTQDNITAPSQVINYQITEQASAASVWAGASRAEWLAEQHSGHTPAYVEIRYPGLTPGSYFRNNLINIDSAENSPETTGHEYGHAVMYLAYGGTSPSEGGLHILCQAASNGLAWSEGFASYYGLVAGGSGTGIDHWTVGDTGVSIENWSCDLQSMTADEGRVTAGIWDLWDSANDNNGNTQNRGRNGVSDANQGNQLVSIDQILQTLWIRKQNNIGDYWADLQTGLQQPQTAPSTTIMNYNWYP